MPNNGRSIFVKKEAFNWQLNDIEWRLCQKLAFSRNSKKERTYSFCICGVLCNLNKQTFLKTCYAYIKQQYLYILTTISTDLNISLITIEILKLLDTKLSRTRLIVWLSIGS